MFEQEQRNNMQGLVGILEQLLNALNASMDTVEPQDLRLAAREVETLSQDLSRWAFESDEREVHIEISAKKGHGKTTVAHLLASQLQAQGAKVSLQDGLAHSNTFQPAPAQNLTGLNVSMSTQDVTYR